MSFEKYAAIFSRKALDGVRVNISTRPLVFKWMKNRKAAFDANLMHVHIKELEGVAVTQDVVAQCTAHPTVVGKGLPHVITEPSCLPKIDQPVLADVRRRILHEAGVAVTPGLDFDPAHGNQWMRISYAVSESEIAEACTYLAAWMKTLRV